MFTTYHIHDFPSPRALNGKFMIERFQDLVRPANLQWPHKHSFYEIIWVKEGSSRHTIDYHDIEIASDTLFFISPGQVHMLSQSERVTGYSITFTEEFLLMNHISQDSILELTFLDDSYTNPSLRLDQAAIDDLEPVIKMMIEETTKESKSPAIINHLLFVLLNRIQRLIAKTENISYDSFQVITFKKFKKLIEIHFKQETSLSYYAEQLFMSVHNLNEIIKKVTGRTAGEVIRDRGMMEAKRMLVHSHFSIGQISDELGFKDFSYFSRQFKNQEGITPLQYRKKMYEKYQNS